MDRIPAGTVIGDGPPAGWSHLIIKSRPRPGTGDFRQVSADNTRLAGFLFTAIVANVSAQGGRQRLDRLAVGMGTRVGDEDVIVTPDSQARLGADLGFLARIVLSRADERLKETVVIARSPTLAVFEAPALMRRGERHRGVVLRYAVLADEKKGDLETILWLLDDGEAPAGPMEWFPPNKAEDCVLHVDAREFTLGSPNEKSFAMDRLPQGKKQIDFPEAIRAVAARPRLSAATATELEAGLRAALRGAGR
jgi:hypothetical protein